jgi:uncharacterized protein YkwD
LLRPLHLLAAISLAGCARTEPSPAHAPAGAEPTRAPTRAPTSAPAAGERGRFAGLTEAHNAERKKVGVPPLRWSRALARHAQTWADELAADGCALEHRRDDPYGENLYWSSASSSAAEVAATWAAEAKGYDHRKNSCKGTCGHYTQMVWSATRTLGCGAARCGDGEVWVCNYDPPGNVVGQSPY